MSLGSVSHFPSFPLRLRDHRGYDEVGQHTLERLLEKQQQRGRYARADHDTPRGGLVREDVGVETVHHAKSVFLSRPRAAGGRTS